MFAAFGQQPLYRNKAFLPSGCVAQKREFCLNYKFFNSFVGGNRQTGIKSAFRLGKGRRVNSDFPIDFIFLCGHLLTEGYQGASKRWTHQLHCFTH